MFLIPLPVALALVWRWRRFATHWERPADARERFALFGAVLIVLSLLLLALVPQRFFRYIAHLIPLCAMSGELAVLDELVAIKQDHPDIVLYLDDAHGLGVFGRGGRGVADHFGVTDKVDFIMGTFSKSMASIGGFIASDDEDMMSYVRYQSRTQIFSAALPAANTMTVLACLDILEREPERVDRLHEVTVRMRQAYRDIGLRIGNSASPIIPIIIGSDEKAFQFSQALFEAGVFALPAVYPAVPRGQAIIRTAFMAKAAKGPVTLGATTVNSPANFDECVRVALAQSPLLTKSAVEIESKRLDVGDAYSGYIPTFVLNTTFYLNLPDYKYSGYSSAQSTYESNITNNPATNASNLASLMSAGSTKSITTRKPAFSAFSSAKTTGKQPMPEMLSIIIPLYNEEDNIAPLFERLVAVLATLAQPYEIIMPVGRWLADGALPLGPASPLEAGLAPGFAAARLAEHRQGRADHRLALWNFWLLRHLAG